MNETFELAADLLFCTLLLSGIWAIVSAGLLAAFVLVEKVSNETKEGKAASTPRGRFLKRMALLSFACIAPLGFFARSARIDLIGCALVSASLFCFYSLLVLYRDKYRAKATEVAGVFKKPGA